ncbi:MAG: MarR family transcriptional regulator [Alphaproteobacteria bacterium]|jgi:DNA-binding MarR family transcriptional regulator|nr:MarR family transcriptional regulator [Alphaproteobacteria bacterium]MBU2041157.1 MarR family transcriptional regulator [Alphaproteobacteria bacterium]MBU2125538.1 MarR family transcriptional regulator [Alphaproteobacteria bacterium]MBU2208503.1 MarR family transcriptional regulator [Alphaproteobacteria bacterium]MBU2289932.1 MarR family transcriptional regulator [Alphaproteobacteria bacterium]
MTLRDIIAFLYVAENEGLNLKELAYTCGFTDSTASRTARSLAAAGSRDALPPAFGLLEVRLNPADRRGRTLHLTEAGRRLRDQLDDAINSAVPILAPEAAKATCRLPGDAAPRSI